MVYWALSPFYGRMVAHCDGGCALADEGTRESPENGEDRGHNLKSPHAWVASTYFAEGYPYSVIHNVVDVFFKEFGASLHVIGLTSLFHLPWNLKFLWGPFLDAFGTKRQWILLTEVFTVVFLLGLALGSTSGAVIGVSSVLFAGLAIVSATQDIAIDGYYLEALDTRDQSRFVGYRAAAYRLAMLFVSGPLLIVVGRVGWLPGLLLAAVPMGILLLFHAWALPRVERARRPLSALFASVFRPRVWFGLGLLAAFCTLGWMLFDSQWWGGVWGAMSDALPWLGRISVGGWVGLGLLGVLLVLLFLSRRMRMPAGDEAGFYREAFVDFLNQPRIHAILAFVILFRVGESFLVKMRYPFLSELGMTVESYGIANGTFGMFASFVATIVGGMLISRHGLRRWIWPFVLSQNVLNLLFMALAWHVGGEMGPTGDGLAFWLLSVVITAEQFGAGLGTAVFMVYLMRCCRPDYKAAHMAILTALMSVGFTVAGVASGFLAEELGFTLYFGLTFVATVPGMLLIFFIPHLDDQLAEA